MTKLIGSISLGLPTSLTEVMRIGRALKKRDVDVLAHFSAQPGHGGHRAVPATAALKRMSRRCRTVHSHPPPTWHRSGPDEAALRSNPSRPADA